MRGTAASARTRSPAREGPSGAGGGEEASPAAAGGIPGGRPVDLGPLARLAADPSVTDLLVNGDGSVWVERLGPSGPSERGALGPSGHADPAPGEPDGAGCGGTGGALVATGQRLSRLEVELLLERIVTPLGLRVDRSSPMVDARLPDGSRIHAVVPPVAVDGPCLAVRRFSVAPLPLEAWCAAPVAGLLGAAVLAGWNVVVSGGTGAGKTTLLNALAGCAPAGERVVTVEDAAELRLPQPHVVRLEARPANAEGAGEVGLRDLVRSALRLRPDRIVVGEVRGAEALDLLQALNTGHAGCLSTVHANGPSDALRRLETLVLLAGVGLPLGAIRAQLASAVDAIVHVARAAGGARRITAVAEVGTAGADADAVPVRLLADGDRVVAAPRRAARRPRPGGAG